MFNDKFEHLKGEISENIFDKIKAFEEQFIKTTSSEKQNKDIFGREDNYSVNDSENKPELKNVFRHNDKLYFGFIGAQDKKYHLIEFSE